MSKKISKDNTTEYDWVLFAHSYFYIARLACQELLDKREEKHDRSLDSKIELQYRVSDLYIAILYNIKHGIEVYIKSLGIFDFESYEKGHDIHSLFQNFRSKMQSKINGDDLDKIEKLIAYFYGVDFLKPKIKELYKIRDIQNDIFRYPDNSVKLQLQWELIIDSFREQDIEEMKRKIEELLELLNKTGFSIAGQSEKRKNAARDASGT